MATIRAYTTIEQSRKLAEILPLESAEKEVVMLSLEGDIVNVYKSLSDASRQTGLFLGNLSEVCNKMPHRLTLGGYKWKFKE